MNYDKYDTICRKHCFYLLICNELSCNDQGNQLLIITNTMNINYNPAAIKFQCIFLSLLFTVYLWKIFLYHKILI